MKEKNLKRNHLPIVLILVVALVLSMLPAPFGGAEYVSAAGKIKAPASLKVKMNNEKRTLKLSWKKQGKNVKTQIFLKAGKGKWKRVTTTSKAACTVKKLKSGVKYRIRLRTKKGKRYSRYTTYKKTILFKELKKKTAAKSESTKAKADSTEEKSDNANKTGRTQTDTGSADTKTGSTKNNSESTATQSARTDSSLQDSNAKQGSKTEAEVKGTSPVIAEMCKLTDLGYSQYVTIAFADGFNKDNTTVNIDGTDINEALTPVSDDGSLMKWEITDLKPSKLTVTSKKNSDDTAVVKLSNNANPGKPVVKKDTGAGFIMTHGPVSIYDYYLTNYDANGNLRIHPAKTTFDLSGKTKDSAIRSYTPEAEIGSDGKATVELMFNWNTEEEKAWFEGIDSSGAVELVQMNEQMLSLGKLSYTKQTDVPHGSSRIAEICIPFPQGNLVNAGRYYVRVKSRKALNGQKIVLMPIHVVSDVAPSFELKESGPIESGNNIRLAVSNLEYAIKSPIETVLLTDPTGKTSELKEIDDWFLYGHDLMTIFNDVERDDGKGVNHIPYNGVYELTISGSGFKTVTKKFKVSGGKDVPISQNGITFNSMQSGRGMASVEFDAMTSASVVSSGSSGSGSAGGSAVSADLLFDADLLANAMLITKLGIENDAANGIARRYIDDVIVDAVFDRSGKESYTFTSFYNAVSSEELDHNRYMSFADFVKSGKGVKSDRNLASHVKEVLEDNLLGDIQEDADYQGKTAPSLAMDAEKVTEGNDAVFSGDSAYLYAITSVVKKNLGNQADQPATFKVYNGKLSISHESLTYGDNTFAIEAKGYRKASVNAYYVRGGEAVSLTLVGDTQQTGDDVVLKADAEGKFFTGLSKVSIVGPDGLKDAMTYSQVGENGNRYYALGDNKTTLTIKGGFFRTAGSYTVTVESQSYQEGLSVGFTVTQKPEEPSDSSEDSQGVVTLKPVSADFTTKTKTTGAVFTDKDTDYLNAITAVTVNGKNFSKEGSGSVDYLQYYDNHWLTSWSSYSGYCLWMSNSKMTYPAQVTVKAEGYVDQTFTIKADGTIQ